MDLHQINSHLHLWPNLADAQAQLLNLSENHTYLLRLPDGEQRILRVHRAGYQNLASIRSELEWLAALRADTEMLVPIPLAGQNHEYVQWVGADRDKRPAVLFEYLPGKEVDEAADDLTKEFAQLGRFAAICHRHAKAWTPSAPFMRQEWTIQSMLGQPMLGKGGVWGDWRTAPGVTAQIANVLEQAHAKLDAQFATYGQGQHRFGLIHADMRLANILRDGTTLKLIDFDDSGFGWFIYDFAAAISFMEDDARVPALKQAWLAGYAEEGAFSAADLAMIDAAIMARRMLLLAWIGGHMDAPLPQKLAPTFAQGTAALAQRFLDGHAIS